MTKTTYLTDHEFEAWCSNLRERQSKRKASPTKCRSCEAKQAEIDRLMLEYCPDEMTPEQLETWKNSQRFIQEATG